MLDNNIKFEKKEAKVYPPFPKGIYQVELLDVSGKENETYDSRQGKTKEKEFELQLSYQFVLLNGTDEQGEVLRGVSVWHNFGRSFLYNGKNGKNDLWRIAEAFLGRNLTLEEEATGITSELLNSFIGKQINVSVEPKENKGKLYNNIIDYLKVNSELQSLTDEEKEDATVEKKEDVKPQTTETPQTTDEVKINEVPFN